MKSDLHFLKDVGLIFQACVKCFRRNTEMTAFVPMISVTGEWHTTAKLLMSSGFTGEMHLPFQGMSGSFSPLSAADSVDAQSRIKSL
jgi:hypothetical protein